MFVLVPSAHIGVRGLFHSLIISPPAASAANEVIIQQAVRGFPSAQVHSAVFSRLGHSSGAELRSPAATGGTLLNGLSCLSKRNMGGRLRKANQFSSLGPTFSCEAGLFVACTSMPECEGFRSHFKGQVQLHLNEAGEKKMTLMYRLVNRLLKNKLLILFS